MKKFLGVLLLVVGSFGGGYYFGQRPVGTLQQTVSDLQQSMKDLSRNVLDTTMGIERDLRRRQGLVDAKSRLVQAKANLFDRNFGDAAKELGEAVEALEGAGKGIKSDASIDAVRDLAGSLREVRLEIAMGKSVPLKRLDELQHRIDQLLNK
ncbi:MAG TPA: hypothetical protein VD738_02015 [Nitrospira sp.]|nr:hypothetical protein [Nitrospira sp.]